MDVWIGNSHIAIGNQFYCSRHDPEQKDGAEKMAYFNDHWDHPGSGQCILLVCTFWLLYGIQVQEPVAGPTENGKIITENTDAEPEPGSGSDSNIPGSDWRTYRAYSEDLHLDDTGALISAFPHQIIETAMLYMTAQTVPEQELFYGDQKKKRTGRLKHRWKTQIMTG